MDLLIGWLIVWLIEIFIDLIEIADRSLKEAPVTRSARGKEKQTIGEPSFLRGAHS